MIRENLGSIWSDVVNKAKAQAQNVKGVTITPNNISVQTAQPSQDLLQQQLQQQMLMMQNQIPTVPTVPVVVSESPTTKKILPPAGPTQTEIQNAKAKKWIPLAVGAAAILFFIKKR